MDNFEIRTPVLLLDRTGKEIAKTMVDLEKGDITMAYLSTIHIEERDLTRLGRAYTNGGDERFAITVLDIINDGSKIVIRLACSIPTD